MKILVFSLIAVFSLAVWGHGCDCEVKAHSPLTGSHRIEAKIIQKYRLEEFSRISRQTIKTCQDLCLKEFYKDMPWDRLKALLVTYSMELIEEKKLGFNCTGLTTLKYPIRVRAKLGPYQLGLVADRLEVVNHEEVCF